MLCENAKTGDRLFEKYQVDEEEFTKAFKFYQLMNDPDIVKLMQDNMQKLGPEAMQMMMGILQMETAAALLVQLRLDSSVFKAENKTETYVLRSVGLAQEIMDIIPVTMEITLTGTDVLTIALLNKAGHVAGELRQQMMLVQLFVGTDS